jgi:hypothetical protein
MNDFINNLGKQDTISQNSILPRDDYIEQLLQWRTPANICELRKFIGKVGYLRPFYPRLNATLNGLYPLLRKNSKFIWRTGHQTQFEAIKELIHAPMPIQDFIAGHGLTIISDAGETGYSVVLKQHDKFIAHLSRMYTPRSIALLSPPVRELYAIKEALLQWQPVIMQEHIEILTDSNTSVLSHSKLEDRSLKLYTRIMAEIESFEIWIAFGLEVELSIVELMAGVGLMAAVVLMARENRPKVTADKLVH